jgi:hypothetical protein
MADEDVSPLAAMMTELAGLQAATFDHLRQKGMITQDEIDQILTTTEQAVATTYGTATGAVTGLVRGILEALAKP